MFEAFVLICLFGLIFRAVEITIDCLIINIWGRRR